MNLMEIAPLIGIALCVIVLIQLTAGAVMRYIRIRREIERDEAYRAGWATWGDTTDLRSAS